MSNTCDGSTSLRDLCDAPDCREGTFIYIEKCPDCNNRCNPKFKLLKPSEVKALLNIGEDKLVIADPDDPIAKSLIEKLTGCNGIKISSDLSGGDHKVKICYEPGSLNIKFTDLLDGPGDYGQDKCGEIDCTDEPDCPCENTSCIGAVLMPKCDGTGVEWRCMSELLIGEIWTENSRIEYQLPAETEGPQVELGLEINAQTGAVPDAQSVYTSSPISQRIVITKAGRYQIDGQAQYAVNKYLNAVRFGVYNWTTGQEIADFKYGGRLNNGYAGITGYDTSYGRDPPQDVNNLNTSMYMLNMFGTAQLNTHMRLEPGEYSLIMKIDTRTDNTGTETGKIYILGKNGDTVINEGRGAITFLRISEMSKYYINPCE